MGCILVARGYLHTMLPYSNYDCKNVVGVQKNPIFSALVWDTAVSNKTIQKEHDAHTS
jgi:hypothetical protein